MKTTGVVVGVIAGFIVGGASLTGSQAAEPTPALTCATVEDCHVIIGRLYGDAKDLGGEVNDLRGIRVKQDRLLEHRKDRITRLTETVDRLRSR